MTRFPFETPPYGGSSIPTPPIFVFEAADVPWELGNDKTGTVNYTVFPRI